MSKADKMFEELGYSKKENNNSIDYSKEWGSYDNESGYEHWATITFWLKEKTIQADEDYEAKALSWEELEAIRTKSLELGWFDELQITKK